MHWFWRAVIALVTGLPLSFVALLLADQVGVFVYIRGLSRYGLHGEALFLVIGGVSSVICLASYGAVTQLVERLRAARAARRRERGRCTHCGYDLTGNLSSVCPECGEGVEQSTGGASAIHTTPPSEAGRSR